MTCSMVFQSPHGKLNYGFMSLDRDIAYFNFTFIKSMHSVGLKKNFQLVRPD